MADMRTDPYYIAEYVPTGLALLRAKLLKEFGLSPEKIGIKGYWVTHKRGHHRSRNFIRFSPYCTDRSYSVSASVNQGGDGNWLAGMDISIDTPRLIMMCKRLDAAVRAGNLEKITEWYGNDDGDNYVDGYDNIANLPATSDSSHLWHLHLSFARSRANDDHTDVFNVLTGKAVPVPVSTTQSVRIYDSASTRVVNTLVPAGSGINTWMEALHHWYRCPHPRGSLGELDHAWRLRSFNNPMTGPGRYEGMEPGATVLNIPQKLGY